MATAASIEASEIRRRGRRRLIGAIVLVVLAVVFIPMLLDSEPRPKSNDVSLEIPAKDKAPPLPAPVPARPEAAKAAAPADAAASNPAPATEKPAAKPAPAKAPEKAPVKTPSPAPSAAQQPKAQSVAAADAKLERFAVQVGAFKDETKLDQAREKLMAARIPHFVERRGDLNRLRAGPYSTRQAAEKALASIKAASLDGQVVPLP